MITITKNYRVKHDEQGVIEYAQCRVTGRFVKHVVAYTELKCSSVLTTAIALAICVGAWVVSLLYIYIYLSE